MQLLKTRFFRAWEGGGRFSLSDSWVNANLVRGRQLFAAKQYKEALAAYQAALEMPANLQEASGPVAGRKGEVDYWIGNAYEALGEMEKARQSWREAAGTSAVQPRGGSGRGAGKEGGRGRGTVGGGAAGANVAQAASYYQALALVKLGEGDRATAIFQRLVAAGATALRSAPKLDVLGSSTTAAQRVQVADAHYLIGLGQLGLNNKDKARQEFSAALQASPDHFAAKSAMATITP